LRKSVVVHAELLKVGVIDGQAVSTTTGISAGFERRQATVANDDTVHDGAFSHFQRGSRHVRRPENKKASRGCSRQLTEFGGRRCPKTSDLKGDALLQAAGSSLIRSLELRKDHATRGQLIAGPPSMVGRRIARRVRHAWLDAI
jgi:hypothetical protein